MSAHVTETTEAGEKRRSISRCSSEMDTAHVHRWRWYEHGFFVCVKCGQFDEES